MSRGAFTLLEVILALLLASLVMLAVAAAVDIYLRLVDVSRTELEQAQLARALLGHIAEDLRNCVQHTKVDLSKYPVPSKTGASDQSATAGSGASGGQSSDSGTTSVKNTGSSSTTTPNKSSTPTPSPTDSKTSSSSGTSSGTSSGGTSGTSGGTSSGGTSGDSSGTSSGDTSSDMTGDEQSQYTGDLANPTALPDTPGLYGNLNQLQIDVVRLPRADQIQAALMSDVDPTSTPPLSSMKTVTYFLGQGAATDSTGAQGAGGTGLVRRELDRAAAAWASQQGMLSDIGSNAPVLAPEVVDLEFRYFDGMEWVEEWDTGIRQGLPMAVEITMAITRPGRTLESWLNANVQANGSGNRNDQPRIYRLMVHLPTGQPTSDQGTSGDSSSSDASQNSASQSTDASGGSQP